jgi:hypothetical protein
MCTPIFTETLFIIAKLCKEPRCPAADEWIKKMWYIYIYDRILFNPKEK